MDNGPQKIKFPDGDPDWDARIAWAEKNHDDISHLVLEKRAHDESMALLNFMSKNPTTSPDIAKKFGWTQEKTRGRIQWLKKHGVEFKLTQAKRMPIVYEVTYRPKKIAFNPPKTTERYH